MTEKKETRGGKRPGSGAKAKTPTATLSFRIPEELVGYSKEHFPGLKDDFKMWLEDRVAKHKQWVENMTNKGDGGVM